MALTDQVIVGRYRLGRLLGSGGFAAVYLGEDLRLHRPVAIKVCSTRRLPPDEAAEAARLFKSEALTLARLRHPGLTAVWDYFNQDDDWFLVMEYVPGETLREVLRRSGGKLPVPQAINYTAQLCEVLRYLHAQPVPVVFRDLKPGNIMVTPEGQLKLIDFGIARLFSPGKAADTMQFGTPGYAPPEQYGGQTEPRSDIYSLGAVAHQMLSGHNPASSPFALPPARSVNPALPQAIELALLRATAYNIADRFPTVDAFCAALQEAIGPAVSGPTVAFVAPPQPRERRAAAPRPPVWTPAPRSLPRRPAEGGAIRVVVLLMLLLVLAGSLAAGAWLLRDQLASVAELFSPRPPAPTTQVLPVEGAVVYVAPGEGGGTDLFVQSGAEVRQLTHYPEGVNAALPALAPDRRRVAYTVNANQRDTLWLVDLDGANPRQLIDEADYPIARAPSWGPDGQRLLVEVARPGAQDRLHDVVEVEVDTGLVRPVLESEDWEGGPAWSPDGGRVAYHAFSRAEPCARIFVLDLRAQDAQPKPVTAPTPCAAGMGDYWPAWSPDGGKIAFERRSADPTRLAVLDVASGEVVPWKTGEAIAGHPTWSPDGDYILFEEQREDGKRVLARWEIATGRIEELNPDAAGSFADWR